MIAVLNLLLVIAAAAATEPSIPTCVAPDGARIVVDLAIEDEERALGLMYRDVLPADRGMIFIFESDERWPFWMKNTFIPLDLIWIDASGTVVEVRAGAKPCRADPCPSYTPLRPGRAVLEVNAGFAAAHGIAAGEVIRCEGVPGYPAKGRVK